MSSQPTMLSVMDLPDEILLHIGEQADSGLTLKSLSLTSARWHSAVQSVLFRSIRLDLGKPLRAAPSLEVLIENPKLGHAVRALELRGRWLTSQREPKEDQERSKYIASLLGHTTQLRSLYIYQLFLSIEVVNIIKDLSATGELRSLKLGPNFYPSEHNLEGSVLGLRYISVHAYAFTSRPENLLFLQQLVRSSTQHLETLHISSHYYLIPLITHYTLVKLRAVDISLVQTTYEEREGLVAFLAQQPYIESLTLQGAMSPFPPLPAYALPRLRSIWAAGAVIQELVPGRPVEELAVSLKDPTQHDWIEAATRSTSSIKSLRIRTLIEKQTDDVQRLEQIVKHLPHVETLGFDIVLTELPKLRERFCKLRNLRGLYLRGRRSNGGGSIADSELHEIAQEFRASSPALEHLSLFLPFGGPEDWVDFRVRWVEWLGDFRVERRTGGKKP